MPTCRLSPPVSPCGVRVLLLAACLAASCLAAARPALSNPVAPTQTLELEVWLNGSDTQRVSTFERDREGGMRASPKELAEIGFDARLLKSDGDGLVILGAVPGLRWRYDAPTQSIFLESPASSLAPTRIDARPTPPPPRPSPTPVGAALDYTFYADATPGHGGVSQTLSGEIDSRVFGPFGAISSAEVASYVTGSPARLTRLETTWSWDDPDALVSYRAGDVVSGGLSWTRPIYLAGLQVARSFDLQPNLVTMPVPSLTGSALTPSTLDLYIDDVKSLSTDVPAGPFLVDHAPISDGAGDAQVVVTDALGRRTRIDLPFYASDSLLKPGLVDFSLEAGFARRSFGIASDDYDPTPALSGTARLGLTPTLTAEAHVEETAGLVELGAGAVAALGRIGVGSMALAASDADGAAGGEVDASFQTRRRRFTLLLNVERTFGDYEDLASWTAERPAGVFRPPLAFRPPSVVDRKRGGAQHRPRGRRRRTNRCGRRVPLAEAGTGDGLALPRPGLRQPERLVGDPERRLSARRSRERARESV
jgi:outer membrane usher protein